MKFWPIRPRCSGFLASALALSGCATDTSDTGQPLNVGTVDGIMSTLPQSCSFSCMPCPEPETAYTCPTVKAWSDLPHDTACGAWDGTYPAVTKGSCAATEPTGEAARKAGAFTGGFVLPDGHRITPAGREFVFNEPDLPGGFPMSILAVPSSRLALVSDGGIDVESLRVVNLDALASGAAPVASYVPFTSPQALFYGLTWLSPSRALASGGGDGNVYAFDVDTTTGQATRVPDKDIPVGTSGSFYSGAIAATADGTRLVVAPSEDTPEFRVMSLGATDYGKQLAAIPTNQSKYVFDLRLDPFDPSGTVFYASDQAVHAANLGRLVEIDVAKNAVTRTIALEKAPAQIVFLDATYLLVTESDSDAIAIVDRASGSVVSHVPVFDPKALHGFSPTALAYDPNAKRLYAALEGINAIEAYSVAGTPPAIAPIGRIPTAWLPTALMIDSDGSLVILNGKGHGGGTDDMQYPWAAGPIAPRMRGSIQYVPAAALADLSASTALVDANRALSVLDGRSVVQCPTGAHDFPVPADNTSGASTLIKHVILVVRENKTFDGVFGDLAGVEGAPNLIMAADGQMQDAIWKNARAMAKTFTNFDNFYTDAEQSIQGHTWTVFGRTTDWMERSWLTTWGRGTRPTQNVISNENTPEEGGVFPWLERVGVPYEDMGEIVGHAMADTAYPGLVYAQNTPDVEKSCYIAGRIRLRCDLKTFTYATQTNDHTFGAQQGSAAPEVMIAVNDEAIGMLLDGLSHSPTWKDALLIVTEDDPSDGGDHIDLHRSLLFMASPWVKRSYVSHGHYDMSSVHKLIANLFGVPYNNELIKNALVPFDAFTSTPDYTPFSYTPRTITAPCNGASAESKMAAAWDFDEIDNQPGLSEQIGRMLKTTLAERGVRVIEPKR